MKAQMQIKNVTHQYIKAVSHFVAQSVYSPDTESNDGEPAPRARVG